jgi:hydroxyacylglutathione hydrolase
MTPLRIRRLPALRDNYLWLLHAPDTGETAVVDPAETGPVEVALAEEGWHLSHILNTHHHYDHVGANAALKERWGCTIVGPRADRDRIPGIDVALGEGDAVAVGRHRARVFDVPGHTRGHIAYWFAGDQALFVGDTIFAAGCGRMFEGTPEQFWDSLAKLRALPDATEVYCAHEYTASNLRYAAHVLPDDAGIRDRQAEVTAQRARGEATVPSPLGLEKRTNPFLRCDDPVVAAAVGLPGASPSAVFGALRGQKDAF